METHIHQGQNAIRVEAEEGKAERVIILLHGRGATAESMMPLVDAFSMPKTQFVIPQASLNRWYPNSAFAPIESNEPDLSSALGIVKLLVEELITEGFEIDEIGVGGFSQGACLGLEYAARHPQKYAGVFAFSGALIGPEEQIRDYMGDFKQCPVFIGGSDVDPWVAHSFMMQSAKIFQDLNAKVDFRTYPNLPHTIVQDEIDAVKAIFQA